jgi:hypothetical protein
MGECFTTPAPVQSKILTQREQLRIATFEPERTDQVVPLAFVDNLLPGMRRHRRGCGFDLGLSLRCS